MNHEELIQPACDYALSRNDGQCEEVYCRFPSLQRGETPDVFGRIKWFDTMVIECKSDKSDFLADLKKPSRTEPFGGVGNFRLYFCPYGLISIDELPHGWGLVYYDEGNERCSEIVPPQRFTKLNWRQQWAVFAAGRQAEIDKSRDIDVSSDAPEQPQRRHRYADWHALCDAIIVAHAPIRLSTVVRMVRESPLFKCVSAVPPIELKALKQAISEGHIQAEIVDSAGTCTPLMQEAGT